MMTPEYEQTRNAISDVLDARDEERKYQDRGSDKWPEWMRLVLAVGAVVVTVVLAYGALNTRITVVESKLDDLKQQISALHK